LRRDVRALGVDLNLGRLAIDALELAVLLIVPDYPDDPDHGAGSAPGAGLVVVDLPEIDWVRSLSHARTLNFPWDVEGALRSFRELLSERVNLDELGTSDPELALAAQILALVWHHYVGSARRREAGSDPLRAIKTELRRKSGRLARSDVVESYLRLLERGADDLHATSFVQVFVVGQDPEVVWPLTTRLRHLGYQVVPIAELAEAERMCRRQAPTAVFVHDASLTVAAGCREAFCGTECVFLYAVTTQSDPSQVLNLFDAGFDDVFSLPRDIDIVAARLRQAVKGIAGTGTAAPAAPGSFQATFAALAFTDLLQALSQSQKSVCIRLARSNGETAVIHLDHGRLAHAKGDNLQGAEAIYRVIAWGDDGHYSVESATEFPTVNVSQPLESLLMEGCRLLDESLV
jgi:DNA-binding response OmpR family regulator